MPELPEVETTRRGVAPHLTDQIIGGWQVRQPRLRWPIPVALLDQLLGEPIREVSRRAKYLLIRTDQGSLIIHLGMSGSLRILRAPHPPGKHDHWDMLLADGACLRYTDPRRFGALLYQPPDSQHPLLAKLGPEPLSDAFNHTYLSQQAAGRSVPIKTLIMNNQVVVGVGNIYANEALFAAGIDPRRASGRIAAERLEKLVSAIKQILAQAIVQGGTTLRDFVDSSGQPGYFKQALAVYGRAGEPCVQCLQPLSQQRIGQRNTFFCRHCQR